MRNKKNIIMLVLLILVALMTGAYAAYTTNLNIGATTSQAGNFGAVLTGCTTEVVKIGTAGAQAPTATCSPTSTNTGEEAICTANFRQPGDSVRCKFNVKNTGNLKIAPSDAVRCNWGEKTVHFLNGGFVSGLGDTSQWEFWGNWSGAAGGFDTSISKPEIPPIGNAITGGGYWHQVGSWGFTFVWNRNRLAPNATLTNELSITLTATEVGTNGNDVWNPDIDGHLNIVCDFPYGQDI